MLILNANNADALHPDAIYRLAIDNDGDLRNDIAFSFAFSEPTASIRRSMCTWRSARMPNHPKRSVS